MKDVTIKALTTLNSENGPVFEKEKDLEVITLEEDAVELKKSQFGQYLRVDVKGSKRMVNLKGVGKDDELKTDKFTLQIWTAKRTLPAQGTRAEITEGTQRVFAVPA